MGDGFRMAKFEERAGAALGGELGRRRAAGGDEIVCRRGEPPGFGAESIIECHVVAPVGDTVEDRPGRNRLAKHFFEADRLRAKLHRVDGLVLGAASLVLDGKRLPRAIGLAVKLDNVGDAVETECGGLQRQSAGEAKIAPFLAAALVRVLVQHPTFGGEAVLGPLPFDMDERALATAESEVLQGREREGSIVEFGQRREAGFSGQSPLTLKPMRRLGGGSGGGARSGISFS